MTLANTKFTIKQNTYQNGFTTPTLSANSCEEIFSKSYTFPHNIIITHYEMAGADNFGCKILVLELSNLQLKSQDILKRGLLIKEMSLNFLLKLFWLGWPKKLG